MSLFLTIFILYILVLMTFGPGRKSAKKRDPGSVFFGIKPLGTLSMTATTTASWFGAATYLVTFDAATRTGFSSLWFMGAPTLFTLIIFILLAPRIRALGHISLPHFFREHYGPAFAAFVTLLIAGYMILLTASQFSAWGQIAALFEMTPASAIITGALCVILYSSLGGFRSVVGTDRLQFILLCAGVLLLLTAAFFTTPSPVLEKGDLDMTRDLGSHLSITLCFTLAWTISPIIWQRITACHSLQTARRGLSLSMLFFSLLIIAVVLAAIWWRPFLEPGKDALLTIRQRLPLWMGLLIEVGLVSAIMSTADTALNTGALALQPFTLKRGLKRWSALNLRGLGVVLLGLLALWISLRHQSILKLLGLAGELMSSGLFVPGMFALLRGSHHHLAGGLSLVAGGGFAVISFVMQTSQITGSWPKWPFSSLIGIGLSLLGYGLGLFVSRR